MTNNRTSGSNDDLSLDDQVLIGLKLLRQAHVYAEDASCDLWDFALEIDQLCLAGVTVSDLRWLVAKGFAEHGQEHTEYGDQHRSFRPSHGLTFDPATCFVLTPSGSSFADKVFKESVVA